MKLNPIGDIPPARAAHAACAIDHNHLAIFGGTCLQGALAPDDLYILEISSEKNSSIWYKVLVQYGIKSQMMVQDQEKDMVIH